MIFYPLSLVIFFFFAVAILLVARFAADRGQLPYDTARLSLFLS